MNAVGAEVLRACVEPPETSAGTFFFCAIAIKVACHSGIQVCIAASADQHTRDRRGVEHSGQHVACRLGSARVGLEIEV